MYIETISGRYGNYFYQRCKGGKTQFKSRNIDWKSNHDPNSGVIKYRQLFHDALSGQTFSSRKAMYEHVRVFIKTHK